MLEQKGPLLFGIYNEPSSWYNPNHWRLMILVSLFNIYKPTRSAIYIYIYIYIYIHGQYINQFPPNTIKVIREFERIQKKICRHKMSIMFNKILHIYIYIYIRGSLNKFQDFFVCALLLIVHTWNSSPLPSNLLRLQCTCCTVPTISGRPGGSPLVWACQWPLSQPLSSPQMSHNDSLWA